MRPTDHLATAIALIFAIGLVTGVAGCGDASTSTTSDGSTTVDRNFTERVFPTSNFWSRPIPANPQIDPRSATWVEYLVKRQKQRASTAPFLTLGKYGVPIWIGDEDDPVMTVGKCRYYPCPRAANSRVRIPKNAKPDPGSDGHIVFIDDRQRLSYELYRAIRKGNTWTGGGGARLNYDRGDAGTGPIEGATAAHLSLLAGLVRPAEVKRGRIDHALQMTVPGIGEGAPRCPANYNVSTTGDPNAPPEGIRFQLDPTLDVDAAKAPRLTKIVARALQKYGAILIDNGGQIAFRGENPIGKRPNPWADVGLAGKDAVSLKQISLEKMRVIAGPDC